MNAIARRTLRRYFHRFRFLAKLATGYIARFQVSGQLEIAGKTLGSELSSCQDIMLIGRTLDMVPTSIATEPIDEPRATEHASFARRGWRSERVRGWRKGPFVVELLNEVLWADNPAQVCDRAFATTAGILKEAARNHAGPGAVHV